MYLVLVGSGYEICKSHKVWCFYIVDSEDLGLLGCFAV